MCLRCETKGREVLCTTCKADLRAGYKGKYFKRRVVGVKRLQRMIKKMEDVRDQKC